MAQTGLGEVLAYLRKTCAIRAARDLSDAELIRRFVTDREEAAFSALVRRHGPMVLGVCRRVLSDGHSAEDAFQATFLVLVRRIASLARNKPLAGWLYGVAQRIALRARTQDAGRRDRERQAADMPRTEPLDELTWQELRAVLDEEIGRLPEKYRTPIVLCYFDGKSHDQAARELGWPKTSLTSRLAKARDLLRDKLSRRGITLSAGALTAALAEKSAGAAVGAMLTIHTVKAAMSVAAGKAVAGCTLSAKAIALAEEGMKLTMGFNGKFVAVMLTIGLAAGGAGLAGYGARGDRATDDPAVQVASKTLRAVERSVARGGQQADKNKDKKKDGPALDSYGDPLPADARMRLGTDRFRVGGNLYTCAYSPDGKLLAAGSADYSVRLFDAATGRPIRQLRGHGIDVIRIAFSSTGGLLASGDALGTIMLWDPANGNLLNTIHNQRPFQQIIWALAFTQDEKSLLVGGKDNSLRLVDVSTGKELRNFEGHEGPVHSVALSPDGQFVASGSRDTTVRLWNLSTAKELREFTGRAAPKQLDSHVAQPVAFSPDGKWLASEGEKHGVCVWDTATGKIVCELTRKGPHNIYTLAFSPDGKSLAAGTSGHELLLWEMPSGKLLQHRSVKRWTTYSGWHKGGISCAAFSPDGKTLAFGEDSQLGLWNIETGQEAGFTQATAGMVRTLSYCQDGKTLIASSDDPRQRLVEWDVTSGRILERLHDRFSSAHRFVLSPDHMLIAAGNREHLSVSERASGKELQRIALPMQRESSVLQAFAYSHDGRFLAAGGESFADHSIHVWEATAGKELPKLQGHGESVWCLAFAPNSGILASCGDDDEIRLHDVTTGKELRKFPALKTNGLTISPNGKLLAAIGSQGLDPVFLGPMHAKGIKVWDLDSGKLLYRIDLTNENRGWQTTHASPVFSPDSKMLATGDIDGTVRVWEVTTGQQRRAFQGHQGAVKALAFSPDGRFLASGSADTTVLLWDLFGPAERSKAK